MIITNIVPKRKKLSAVYIDGEFALKIDTETIISSPYSVGSEIDDEQLKELIDRAEEKRAKEKALWLLSTRDHSKRELETKIRKTNSAESAQKAVERMEELGLVDDEKFARRYAEELINIKHLSVRGAKYKLTEKGIDKNLADEILEELAPDPREHIEILIEKKYRKNLSDEKGRRKTVAALQRMGYSWGDIKAVMSNYFEDEYI
ncbi:MAG: regulatory protein RecX [Ruminococcus sp.]|nr:regulatory protein RecX [Ruminococcus sp.]